jgi:hypothetical protein
LLWRRGDPEIRRSKADMEMMTLRTVVLYAVRMVMALRIDVLVGGRCRRDESSRGMQEKEERRWFDSPLLPSVAPLHSTV